MACRLFLRLNNVPALSNKALDTTYQPVRNVSTNTKVIHVRKIIISRTELVTWYPSPCYERLISIGTPKYSLHPLILFNYICLLQVVNLCGRLSVAYYFYDWILRKQKLWRSCRPNACSQANPLSMNELKYVPFNNKEDASKLEKAKVYIVNSSCLSLRSWQHENFWPTLC